MKTRSQLDPMPAYFDRYINLADDVPLLQALQISLDEINQFPVDTWKALGSRVYAPGKWTVKDLLQHLIDCERIFNFRALAFARGETERLPSFDEDLYADNAHIQAETRDLERLIEEMRVVRQGTILLFESFSADMLAAEGMGFKGPYSVHAIGFVIAGHQRWHLKVLEERYYPLLG